MKKLSLFAAFSLLCVSLTHGLTHTTSQAITNSTLDSTPVGATSPASGSFTSLLANNGLANWWAANGTVASFGDASYLAHNIAGTGDSDLIAATTGSHTSSFNFYLNHASLSLVMTLDSSGILHIPAGVVANLTGNVTGNVTGNATTSSSTTGNAATATALAANPSTCTNLGQFTGGILASGAPASCQTAVYAQKGTVTVAAQTFATSANTHFTLSFSLAATPGAGYVVTCTPTSDFGDEVQYTCWTSGSTLFVKITHSSTGLPFTSNTVSLNYMVEQP